MRHNFLETVLGAVVLFVAGIFLYIAYSMGAGGQLKSSYMIKAKFDRIDGIAFGNDVKIGGVKVGSVDSIDIDPNDYKAIVCLKIKENLKIADDSSAEIFSDGLLGGKYINITPGDSTSYFKSGDEIENTQSSVSLEQLLSKFLFSSSTKDEKKN